MEEKGKPSKHVNVSSSAEGGFNIKVNKQPGLSPKPNYRAENDQKTLHDYIPPAFDDPQIDKAIDDIIVSESNEVLIAEDSMQKELDSAKKKKKKASVFKRLFKSKWLYIGIGLVIIAIFATPYSRYLILGKFVEKDYELTIIDSVTKTPVSGATVSIGKETSTTNAEGQTEVKLYLGKHKYTITKQYYAKTSGDIFVGLSKPKDTTVHLVATGRRVSITVINKLSSRLLEGVKISILDTNATTNSLGQTQIVLPTKDSSYEATITADGFNTLTVPIKVTTSKNANVVSLVPTGSIYYLSDATGTINVIKANLDGSNPTIELAGTGNETSATTLMASPDWKYLVLEAQRTGSKPELYVINTATGNLTEFDSSSDSFKLIGWSDDMFIYDEVSSSEDTSITGREQLKSYNAITGQLNVLDQNQVNGSSPSYAYQSFSNFELLSSLVVYTTSWNSVGSYDLSNLNDTIRSVEPNGLNKKDYSTFAASTTGAMSIVRNLPNSLYISVNNASTNQTSYFSFTNGAVNSASINSSTFTQSYPTYYLSPSGEESLWTTNQNNEPETFTANQTGQNSKRILLPAGYTTVGWYDNVYMLLTKGSDLYIAPATGSNSPVLVGSILTASQS